tara:strand:- start:46631 stop:47959 length:1329 start_codon:yes stop_codon:yes gene_type:complete
MKKRHITILGGGPAGLAVGYYAKKAGIPFTIFEAKDLTGGNCITYKKGDFLFDSGAHRLHDKDPEITDEVKYLLGDSLHEVNMPSMIYDEGKYLEFPLKAKNLFKHLGLITFVVASFQVLINKIINRKPPKNFEELALNAYGKIIADKFLLFYTKKLWGVSCDRLLVEISGKRLKGLDLKSFVLKTILGKKYKSKDMEGRFYYPQFGIGMIMDSLAEKCEKDNIRLNSKVTSIKHENNNITEIEINNHEWVQVEDIVSTLPISLFVKLMSPQVPNEISDISNRLSFRQLILATYFLDKKTIANAATIYTPNPDFPITRVTEPRNRSEHMAPINKTSLSAEIPCSYNDEIWKMEEDEIIDYVQKYLLQMGLFKKEEVLGAAVVQIPNAYPVLEVGTKEIINELNNYLSTFKNFKTSGRSGKFVYSWIHDMMRYGKDIIDELNE